MSDYPVNSYSVLYEGEGGTTLRTTVFAMHIDAAELMGLDQIAQDLDLSYSVASRLVCIHSELIDEDVL